MNQELVDVLKKGKIAIIPTDTIYGIVGLALIPEVVEKIYQLRKRTTNKPFIILISSIDDLKNFNVKLTNQQRKFLEKNWPNPLSVVLPVGNGKWKYLHRGTNSLAFRMPKDEKLLGLLKKVGPLIAPSANFEGEKPAEDISEAKKYFGNNVFYVHGERIKSQPSTIVSLGRDGSYKILRKGIFKIG